MKQYVGFVRDHSISMQGLSHEAKADYNRNIAAIRAASEKHNLDTIVNTVKCGVGYLGRVEVETVNSTVHMLKPITHYETEGGGTPLFDSVGQLIELMTRVPDYDDPNVSFLVVVITDGFENRSKNYNAQRLSRVIQDLQRTDRWTLTFRVPRGHAEHLTALGIPRGNILEWDQTEEGFRHSNESTVEAFDNFYEARSRGKKSSSSFYTDMRDVSPGDVRKKLGDITKQLEVWDVKNAGSEIRTFCEWYTGDGKYLKGAAFYELTKPEKIVQDYKKIIVHDKVSGKYYGGVEGRKLLGLPDFGTVSLRPGAHGQYNIFVQSTSVNRKLIKGTKLVYWVDAVLQPA